MKKRTIYYFNSKIPGVEAEIGLKLAQLMLDSQKKLNEIVLICIGSDRSTGDSLGPLVGHLISKSAAACINIYGTLDKPVHAANLEETLKQIHGTFEEPFIIAVDASLGTKEHIGYLTLGQGPLSPGLGVQKTLPPVGDLHITGIVNLASTQNQMILQTTRLSLIMGLASIIKDALLFCLAPAKDKELSTHQASYIHFLSSPAYASLQIQQGK